MADILYSTEESQFTFKDVPRQGFGHVQSLQKPETPSERLLKAVQEGDKSYFPSFFKDPEVAKQVDTRTIVKAAILSLPCQSSGIKAALFDELFLRYRTEHIDPSFMSALKDGFDILSSRIRESDVVAYGLVH